MSEIMYLKALIQSGKTVFSSDDLAKLWQIEDRDYLKTVTNRLFKRGEMLRISRGIYAITDAYDVYEYANKLKTPSYVSLETVLQKEGVIFQDYGDTVFSVSNNTFSKKVGDRQFYYAKIDDKILMDPAGVVQNGQANVATVERAICDRIYLSPDYHFDNMRPVRAEKLRTLSSLYNTRVQNEVANIIVKINEK
jgi:predicted transcriptional regulator of viral defense system